MEFIGLIVAAVVAEGIITYITEIFEDKKFEWKHLASICIGVLIAFTYKIDLFEILELKASIPYIGIILTGILICRGSNYVFELVEILMNFGKRIKLSLKS